MINPELNKYIKIDNISDFISCYKSFKNNKNTLDEVIKCISEISISYNKIDENDKSDYLISTKKDISI